MRILKWLRKHPLLLTILLVIIAPPLLIMYWWNWPSVPTVSVANVMKIQIQLEEWDTLKYTNDPDKQQKKLDLTTTDPEQIGGLLDVFHNTASRASEHKCGSSGMIKIYTKSGSVEELEILPGHDREYYEYRYGSRINKVDRQQFLAALHAIGVKQIKLSSP